ncbi:hypothetical protein EK21DRAFT_84476 [Setomelanomma holmii]|uniref:Uncharacterized protein n=1 Tax=Setomelanomma holmii TaxID=210430 RepID=A0A9P4HJI2_9PLEO|nr:hypothetical protein EK21DRAFT_84476 [Setomelanomma holmii]
MSSTNNNTELTLQICFGIFGVLGTIITLASLHHRDSLGIVDTYNRHGDQDLEAGSDTFVDDDAPVRHNLGDRRPTLPPTYEQSSGSVPNTVVFEPSDANVSCDDLEHVKHAPSIVPS